MHGTPHIPSLKSFVVAASILREIEAQQGGAPERIPIIVCLKESAEHPEQGVQASKEAGQKLSAR